MPFPLLDSLCSIFFNVKCGTKHYYGSVSFCYTYPHESCESVAYLPLSSVSDPGHFDTDPNLWIRLLDNSYGSGPGPALFVPGFQETNKNKFPF
jgi:hypothetical protein